MIIDDRKCFPDCKLHIYSDEIYINSYQVHRYALADCSNYFKMLFNKNEYIKINDHLQLEFNITLPFEISNDVIIYIFQSFYGIRKLKTLTISQYLKVTECYNYFLVEYKYDRNYGFLMFGHFFHNELNTVSNKDLIDFILGWISLECYFDVLSHYIHMYEDKLKKRINLENEEIINKMLEFVKIYGDNDEMMKYLLLFIMVSMKEKIWKNRGVNFVEDISAVLIFLEKIKMTPKYIAKLKAMFGHKDYNEGIHFERLYMGDKPIFPNIDYTHEDSKGIFVSQTFFVDSNNTIKPKSILIKRKEKITLSKLREKSVFLSIKGNYVDLPLGDKPVIFVTIILFDILLDQPLIIKKVYARERHLISKDYPYYVESINDIPINCANDKNDKRIIIWPNDDIFKNLSRWTKFNIIFEPTSS